VTAFVCSKNLKYLNVNIFYYMKIFKAQVNIITELTLSPSMGPGPSIGPEPSIGPGPSIGPEPSIGPGLSIGPGPSIGPVCQITPSL